MIDFILDAINESFQDQVAKPRTSGGHKIYLDGGRKDLIKHGQPFNQARPVDNSNAFLAKEENDVEEATTSAAVQGTVGSFVGFDDKDNKKHKRNSKMINRETIAEQIAFKEQLCRMIQVEKNKNFVKNFNYLKIYQFLLQLLLTKTLCLLQEYNLHQGVDQP